MARVMEGNIMSKNPGWKVCLLPLVLFLFVESLNAQLTRGFVSGLVTDSTNAVIRDVAVTLTSKETNISRETRTNTVGFYRFAAIEPGDYSIEFKKGGFETHKIDDVTVKTAQEVVINRILAVAPVAVELSVVETPGIELAKTTATVERTLTEREILELPMQVYKDARDISRSEERRVGKECRL